MLELEDISKFKRVFCREFLMDKNEFENYIKNDFNDERFGLFLKRNNLNNKNLVFQEQKHTDHIKLIDKSFLKKRNIIPNNDALITMEKDLYLCAYTADCVPVTLFDPESESVGIIHSGWKGTLNLIVQKTAKMMYESLKINYPDLRCYLGSSIMNCCYEVSRAKDSRIKDFVNQFGRRVIKKAKEKIQLNLHEAIKIQLKRLGILEKNIKISPNCTCCSKKHRFPSYYREGKEYSRSILSIIGIKK